MDIKPKNLLKRVLRFARDELERRSRQHDQADAPRAHVAPQDDLAAQVAARAADDDGVQPTSDVHGLEVVRHHEGGPLTLRWAVSDADVQRARTLIAGHSVLCVRLVNFTKARDDVLREVQDRPGVELRGDCEIGEPLQRAVVSLGLRAGDRFVSIAHHVI